MPVVPAMMPFAWRRPSMNRATVMIHPCAVPVEKGFGPVQEHAVGLVR
jgi:hypothetical protein